MNILGHELKFGKTWDEMLPLLEKGTRESLNRPDENTWEAVYHFPGEHLKVKVVFKREGMSPYKLADYDLF